MKRSRNTAFHLYIHSCFREWVEKLLAVKFDNLTELALHLLDKMYVDNRYVLVLEITSIRERGKQIVDKYHFTWTTKGMLPYHKGTLISTLASKFSLGLPR